MEGDWGFSSSSDEYDDPPVFSTWKEDAPFYESFLNEDYGPDWPEHLMSDPEESAANANGDQTLDTLNTSVTELNNSVHQMQKDIKHIVGYIHHTERSKANNRRPPPPPPYVPPKVIPLEKIDMVDMPIDPRKHVQMDATDFWLRMPSFFGEFLWLQRQIPVQNPKNGRYKMPNSYIRQCNARRSADPRLRVREPEQQADLFSGPVRPSNGPRRANGGTHQTSARRNSVANSLGTPSKSSGESFDHSSDEEFNGFSQPSTERPKRKQKSSQGSESNGKQKKVPKLTTNLSREEPSIVSEPLPDIDHDAILNALTDDSDQSDEDESNENGGYQPSQSNIESECSYKIANQTASTSRPINGSSSSSSSSSDSDDDDNANNSISPIRQRHIDLIEQNLKAMSESSDLATVPNTNEDGIDAIQRNLAAMGDALQSLTANATDANAGKNTDTSKGTGISTDLAFDAIPMDFGDDSDETLEADLGAEGSQMANTGDAGVSNKTSPTIDAVPNAKEIQDTPQTATIETTAGTSKTSPQIAANSVNLSSTLKQDGNIATDIGFDINAIDISFETDMEALDENELQQYAQQNDSGEVASFGENTEGDVLARIALNLSNCMAKLDSIHGTDAQQAAETTPEHADQTIAEHSPEKADQMAAEIGAEMVDGNAAQVAAENSVENAAEIADITAAEVTAEKTSEKAPENVAGTGVEKTPEKESNQPLPTDEQMTVATAQITPPVKNAPSPTRLIFVPPMNTYTAVSSPQISNVPIPSHENEEVAKIVAKFAKPMQCFVPLTPIPGSMPTTSSIITGRASSLSENDFAWSSGEDESTVQDDPCNVSKITLPNLNTSSYMLDLKQCRLCNYHAKRGWKILSKHYVRKHPNVDIPTSRLPAATKAGHLAYNPIVSTALLNSNGITIKSLCLFCDRSYDMNVRRWMLHFIAHTGEYEYECNVCSCRLIADLHKHCRSTNNLRRLEHELKDNQLFAHTCTMCNYTQLSKDNLLKHIDSEHQVLVSDGLAVEIMLLNWIEPESSAEPIVGDNTDDKNTQSLMLAKLQNSHFGLGRSSVELPDAIELSDDEDDENVPSSNSRDNSTAFVDLTLTDDENEA